MVTRKLWDVGIEDGAAFVLFHPFAKRKYQQWSLQKYKDLSRQIFESGKKTIFLSEKNGRDISDVASVCDITLPQLSVLCEKAKLFIGNNSGPLHVAAAMGTATLAVQGPTSPEWNVYWTDAPHRRVTATSVPCIPCEKFGQVFWDCINDEQPMACMEAVSVEEVYRAAMDLLS